MKISSISNVFLVGALILGVWVAWSATGPQQISGNQLVAGCPKNCNDAPPVTCPNKPSKTCTFTYYKCDTSGDRECYPTNNWACTSGANCQWMKHQSCPE
jgi:hypothetical protein